MTRVSIRPIKPTKPMFTEPKFRKAIDNALTQSAKAIRVDFLVTAQSWSHKPGFKVDKGDYYRDIYTLDEIYSYVNYGTKPHIISSQFGPGFGPGPRRLVFQRDYQAKTRPDWLGSRGGGKSGPVVFARQVRHPGTSPRNFAKNIKKKWDAEWPRQLARALASAYW